MSLMLLLCPNCAAQLPPTVWKVVGSFVAAPFVIALVVIVTVRALLRQAERRAGNE